MLFATASWAAVPVEDMSTRDIRASEPPVSAGASVPGAQPGQNAQLFYELQLLQSEIQQLRGLVEDQAYEISRLRDLQRSQYLDIDRRLTEGGRSASQLSPTTSAPVASLSETSPVVSLQDAPGPESSGAAQVVRVPEVQTASKPSSRGAPAVTEPPTSIDPVAKSETQEVVVPDEKAAFDRAFELMKEQQFEQSISAYQRVVESFPDGNYAPESRYWLGELYLMSDRLEAARGSFVSVVEVYPAHQKVPLSLYKLGVVNHRLGATPAALEYLDNVVTRYPDTPAAGLARTYAAELR